MHSTNYAAFCSARAHRNEQSGTGTFMREAFLRKLALGAPRGSLKRGFSRGNNRVNAPQSTRPADEVFHSAGLHEGEDGALDGVI